MKCGCVQRLVHNSTVGISVASLGDHHKYLGPCKDQSSKYNYKIAQRLTVSCLNTYQNPQHHMALHWWKG